MRSRFLVWLATLLLGSLFIEIAMYHPAVAVQRDPVAVVPALTAALAIFGGFTFLALTSRPTAMLFASICIAAIVVGLIGTAIHLALHASSIAVLATQPNAWLGNPPTLAPLSFSVGGCLGIAPILWSEPKPAVSLPSRLLEALAGFAGLAAVITAATIYGEAAPMTCVIAGLALGSIGFILEAASSLAFL
jgi:hypothetical protein